MAYPKLASPLKESGESQMLLNKLYMERLGKDEHMAQEMRSFKEVQDWLNQMKGFRYGEEMQKFLDGLAYRKNEDHMERGEYDECVDKKVALMNFEGNIIDCIKESHREDGLEYDEMFDSLEKLLRELKGE